MNESVTFTLHNQSQAKLLGRHAPAHIALCDRLWNSPAAETHRAEICRITDCRAQAVLLQDATTGRIAISKACCMHRLCPACGAAKLHRMREHAEKIVAAMDSPRFITLTTCATPDSLSVRIKHLRESFARLRRSLIWRRHFSHGIAVIEVKWSPRSKAWHPHLHIVVDGTYVQKCYLVEAWKTATGGSYIVDITKVHSRKEAVQYVCKYVSKSTEIDQVPIEETGELLSALKGLRTHQCFGKGVRKIIPPKEKKPVSNWDQIASLGQIHREARKGCETSQALLRVIYQLANCRVQNASPRAIEKAERLQCEAAQLVRAWKLTRPVDPHHDIAGGLDDPPAVHRDDPRPLRLWEECDTPRVGLAD